MGHSTAAQGGFVCKNGEKGSRKRFGERSVLGGSRGGEVGGLDTAPRSLHGTTASWERRGSVRNQRGEKKIKRGFAGLGS